MQRIAAICFLLALAPLPAISCGHLGSDLVGLDQVFDRWEDVSFELEHGSVMIRHDEGRRESVVEVTEDEELIVNGKAVKLDHDQRDMVADFYERCVELHESAVEIGRAGAKVGLEGAKLGARAIGCLFKLASASYDEDDMERELEREAQKIEAKAAVLERRADDIEENAEHIERLTDRMCDKIPELDRLRWF